MPWKRVGVRAGAGILDPLPPSFRVSFVPGTALGTTSGTALGTTSGTALGISR